MSRIKELERAARLGLCGAMITEYPLEDRRYDQSEYEPFWAAAAALEMPLSLHTATRRQGRIRGAALADGKSSFESHSCTPARDTAHAVHHWLGSSAGSPMGGVAI